MNRCEFCKIDINQNIENCPLCFRSLKHQSGSLSMEYPKYKKLDKTILSFGFKVLLFIFISLAIISLFLNYLLWNGKPWSLIILASFLNIWILIKNTIIGKWSYGSKLLLQLLGFSVLLIVIDIYANMNNWSVNYVIPMLIILANIIITVKTISTRMKWRNYSVFLIIVLFLGFIPIILFTLNIATILWPSFVSLIYSILTFIAFSIFSPKRFKQELTKIFHI